jgi:starch-binding outer membrane protein, SusD/RagB family
VRLKLAEKNLNGSLHAMLIEKENNKWVYKVIPAAEGTRKFFAKNYLYPIPQSAIDKNKNLTQNQGY